MNTIIYGNAVTDARPLTARLHFDNEEILGGRGHIKTGLETVKAQVRLENFEAARRTLGGILHTLQVIFL